MLGAIVSFNVFIHLAQCLEQVAFSSFFLIQFTRRIVLWSHVGWGKEWEGLQVGTREWWVCSEVKVIDAQRMQWLFCLWRGVDSSNIYNPPNTYEKKANLPNTRAYTNITVAWPIILLLFPLKAALDVNFNLIFQISK